VGPANEVARRHEISLNDGVQHAEACIGEAFDKGVEQLHPPVPPHRQPGALEREAMHLPTWGEEGDRSIKVVPVQALKVIADQGFVDLCHPAFARYELTGTV
jgi:hypothetical protein